jgi:hypothetical protein
MQKKYSFIIQPTILAADSNVRRRINVQKNCQAVG